MFVGAWTEPQKMQTAESFERLFDLKPRLVALSKNVLAAPHMLNACQRFWWHQAYPWLIGWGSNGVVEQRELISSGRLSCLHQAEMAFAMVFAVRIWPAFLQAGFHLGSPHGRVVALPVQHLESQRHGPEPASGDHCKMSHCGCL